MTLDPISKTVPVQQTLKPAALASKPAATTVGKGEDAALRDAARSFEAVFMAEMLSKAGVGDVGSEFSGGYAADTYRSLLSREWAEMAADRGGFGLADQIYKSLAAKSVRDD